MALIDDFGIANLIKKCFGRDRLEELRTLRAERRMESEQLINQGFNPARPEDAFGIDDSSIPSDAFPEGW